MIKINLTNIRCKITGDIKEANKLRNNLKFRHPNAWFLRPHMPKGWDGNVQWITENATFKVGLLPQILEKCKELDIKVVINDIRELPDFTGLPKKLGYMDLRDYQLDALYSLVNNKLPDGTPWPIGVINAATNAGKSLMASGLHKSYRGCKTLLLLNQADLFNQAKDEYPKMLPGVDIGFVQGSKNNHWGDFTIAMVQTLSRNIKNFRYKLEEMDIVIIDEADQGTSKQYKTVLNTLYNTTVRVGLSGSIYLSKLKKHQLKNFELRSFFSDEVFIITKKEMVKKGFSSNLVIKVNKIDEGVELKGNYKEEYDTNITFNQARNNKIVERVRFNLDRGRLPILIICRYHNHVDEVMSYVSSEFGKDYTVNKVHHKTPNRKEIIEAFRNGYIDILISSLIIKRGQNLPLIRCLINAAGGDSEENVLQIMGRAERTHKSKKKTILEDFLDPGIYLKRHAKHRVVYYKKQGFKVIQLY